MVTRGLGLFGTFCALLSLVAADTSFITPPQPGNSGDFTQNPTYELGDEIEIKWKSNNKDVSIQMWRTYPLMSRLERPVAILGNTEGSKQPWTVDVTWPMDFDKTKPAVYYFSLYETGSITPDANSHYFNVTTAEATAPSAKGYDATADAGLELRSEKGQDESPADDEPYVAPPLSKAGKIGLAVVCIVGGGIVIGCYIFVAYWTIRHNRERVYYEEEDEEAAELNEDEDAAAAEYQDEKDDIDYLEKSDKDETIARKRALPRGDDDEIRQIA